MGSWVNGVAEGDVRVRLGLRIEVWVLYVSLDENGRDDVGDSIGDDVNIDSYNHIQHM